MTLLWSILTAASAVVWVLSLAFVIKTIRIAPRDESMKP